MFWGTMLPLCCSRNIHYNPLDQLASLAISHISPITVFESFLWFLRPSLGFRVSNDLPFLFGGVVVGGGGGGYVLELCTSERLILQTLVTKLLSFEAYEVNFSESH